MAARTVSAAEEPMRWHLYVVFDDLDRRLVESDCRRLEELGLRVHPLRRSAADDAPSTDDGIASDVVDRGVQFSQRCLIYLSKSFVQAHRLTSDVEVKAVVEKANRFDRNAVIVLEVDPAEAVKLPDDLRGFSSTLRHRPADDGSKETAEFWNSFAADVSKGSYFHIFIFS